MLRTSLPSFDSDSVRFLCPSRRLVITVRSCNAHPDASACQHKQFFARCLRLPAPSIRAVSGLAIPLHGSAPDTVQTRAVKLRTLAQASMRVPAFTSATWRGSTALVRLWAAAMALGRL